MYELGKQIKVKYCHGQKNQIPAMDAIESGDEDYHIFKQEDLFSEALPIMKEIRRQGKLCDVKLNVGLVQCRVEEIFFIQLFSHSI